MLTLFAFTLFISAFLLFWVQLMVAKMILPLLGGAPSVWNTCQFFFQATLLLGYSYSHLTTKWWGTRRQAAIHSCLLIAAIAFLPISLAKGLQPPDAANPIPWLLTLLLISVGFPFFIISTSAPLIQKWFTQTDHPASSDPYFLYAASNLGSMLGVLSYPILIEPNSSLTQQSWLWEKGYILLVLLTLGCAVYLWRTDKSALARSPQARKTLNTNTTNEDVSPDLTIVPPTNQQKAQWVLLSFIPSSLLLGVTTYLTTDLAAFPLLWAIPLAIYLLSFILTFAKKPLLPHNTLVKNLPLALTLLIILALIKLMQPVWLLLPIHLMGFLITACVFHGELAQSRPSAKYLTSFYLYLSVGGVLGGMFNAIAAPLLFPSVLEYPLIMGLSILLLQNSDLEQPTNNESERQAAFLRQVLTDNPELTEKLTTKFASLNQNSIEVNSPLNKTSSSWLGLSWIALISLAILFGSLLVGLQIKSFNSSWLGIVFAIALLLGLRYAFAISPVRFSIGIALIVLMSLFSLPTLGTVLDTERSFFGVNRVLFDQRGNYHTLLHGTTIHGKQSLDPNRHQEPLTYFYPTGPIGQVFQTFNTNKNISNVAVMGLGIGTLAAYAEPTQKWTFYEIDPLVEKLASNPNYFTFLQDKPTSVVLGDARLRLADVPNNHYDLIIMDAFSSDSIPVHLVTKEAIELYLSKLSKQGVIVINISNRHINLEPVLNTLAKNLGLSTLRQLELNIPASEKARGKSASHWVLLARNPQDFSNLTKDSRWQPIPEAHEAKLWTDDFSNIFSTLRFQ